MTLRWHGNSWIIYLALASSCSPSSSDDVEDPFSAIFRTLLPKVNCRLGLVIVVPLIGLEIWVRWGCEGWTSVLGLGSGEEVDGTPAGLLAWSRLNRFQSGLYCHAIVDGLSSFFYSWPHAVFQRQWSFYEICEKGTFLLSVDTEH